MKVLGVIGGLGPMATAYFMQQVTQMSDAQTDQEHMEMLIHSKPQIPDRTQFILGKSVQNPLPEMINIGKNLVAQGAEVIAIPCITAHYFHQQLEDGIGVSVIHGVEETADYLKGEEIARVGIMATSGTIESGLFQEALNRYGIEAIIPEEADQKKVMQLIYDDVKAGNQINMNRFREVSDGLFAKGAQLILLACTELSIIKRDHPLDARYLDVLDVLARRAVMDCGKLKQEYECLLGNLKKCDK